MAINFRVEFGETPIRNVAVQCPYCGNWFVGSDVISKGSLRFKSGLQFTEFYCPLCNHDFSAYDPDRTPEYEEIKIQECNNHFEVYKDCKKKKVVWA